MEDREIMQALFGKRKPIAKRRKKKKANVGELRRQCFERDGGRCQLRISFKCWGTVSWDYGHMHHLRHRSLGGKDVLENVTWSCPACHMAHHSPEKVVPKK